MSKIWVNGKYITSDNPKAKLWTPPPKPEPVFWGNCACCGKIINEGDPVWTVGEFEVTACYGCYDYIGEAGHCDCAGLMLPGIALEG